MPLTPQDFVRKWKRVTAREKQTYQEHFIDLCHLVGHPTPIELDPTGEEFGFEIGAKKTTGGQGWADAAKLGYFAWEYKGRNSDLSKAYDQLLRYRDSLQNPPMLIVSDINTIIIQTNYTNFRTKQYTFSLDDLLNPESLRVLKAVFHNPDELKPKETVQSVTEQAAVEFSVLADLLRKYGEDPQKSAHFHIRILFCLFAQDIGLLPPGLLARLIEQTRHSAVDFASVLSQLFGTMSKGGYFGVERIPHIDGGLSNNADIVKLDSESVSILAPIDKLDWSSIELSIFGTLFERGLDPAKCSQLGAHYTSKEDILLIVEPVLMALLRCEWAEVKEKASALADERDLIRKNESEMIKTEIRSRSLVS